MAINISDVVNNSISDNNPNISNVIKQLTGNAKADANQAGKLIRTLLAGDIFNGVVKEVNKDNASILLNDGTMLTAKLANNASLIAGTNATFIVENNNSSQLQIKQLPSSQQQFVLIEKALEASNLPVNQNNINIVNELLKLNMPINSSMLNDMARYSARFPDANLNTIANLIRLEIPVTTDNINSFEAYKSFDGRLQTTLVSLESNILMSITNSNDNSNEVLNNLNEFVNSLYSSFEENAEIPSTSIKTLFSMSEIEQLKTELNNILDIKNQDNNELFGKIKDGSLTVKELFNTLTQSAQTQQDTSKIKEFFMSDSFNKIFHEIFNDIMRLKPQDVSESKDVINNFYNRIKNNIQKIISNEKNSVLGENVNKNLAEIKNNIDFMNDLNKNMTYFQMPVKFSESEGNGELYVFTNKKKLAGKTDNISALLHLDMENLGPMDIFVKLNGKAVSTNFVLESEELLDFVYSHIDELNKRLEQLGYSTHVEMKVSDKSSEIDFVRDFIEGGISHSLEGGQYLFDSKV